MARRLATWLTVLTCLVGTPTFAAPAHTTFRGGQPEEARKAKAADAKAGLEDNTVLAQLETTLSAPVPVPTAAGLEGLTPEDAQAKIIALVSEGKAKAIAISGDSQLGGPAAARIGIQGADDPYLTDTLPELLADIAKQSRAGTVWMKEVDGAHGTTIVVGAVGGGYVMPLVSVAAAAVAPTLAGMPFLTGLEEGREVLRQFETMIRGLRLIPAAARGPAVQWPIVVEQDAALWGQLKRFLASPERLEEIRRGFQTTLDKGVRLINTSDSLWGVWLSPGANAGDPWHLEVPAAGPVYVYGAYEAFAQELRRAAQEQRIAKLWINPDGVYYETTVRTTGTLDVARPSGLVALLTDRGQEVELDIQGDNSDTAWQEIGEILDPRNLRVVMAPATSGAAFFHGTGFLQAPSRGARLFEHLVGRPADPDHRSPRTPPWPRFVIQSTISPAHEVSGTPYRVYGSWSTTGLEEQDTAAATTAPRLDYAAGTELKTELAIQSLKKGQFLGLKILKIGIEPSYRPFYYQATGKFSSPALASARSLELQAVAPDGAPTADAPKWWPVANVLAQSPKLVTLTTAITPLDYARGRLLANAFEVRQLRSGDYLGVQPAWVQPASSDADSVEYYRFDGIADDPEAPINPTVHLTPVNAQRADSGPATTMSLGHLLLVAPKAFTGLEEAQVFAPTSPLWPQLTAQLGPALDNTVTGVAWVPVAWLTRTEADLPQSPAHEPRLMVWIDVPLAHAFRELSQRQPQAFTRLRFHEGIAPDGVSGTDGLVAALAGAAVTGPKGAPILRFASAEDVATVTEDALVALAEHPQFWGREVHWVPASAKPVTLDGQTGFAFYV